VEPLRKWVRDDKPVWGTCAGLILLANDARGTEQGGQELLGGLDVTVQRNYFGSQVGSFSEKLQMPSGKTDCVM
jgi:5'-phosphate synthase pdxT subunit